jgi:hypothetical protein
LKRAFLTSIVFGLLLLSACTPATPAATATAEPSPTPPIFSASTPLTPLDLPTATPAPAETGMPSSSASTPAAAKLPPEEWQKWPIVPQVTDRARQIYQEGLAKGNDPHHFSKIGDCQSVNAAFLGMFDRPGYYKLTGPTTALQEAIDYFNGSFNRDSLAVKGGFNAAAVLSPLWANPDYCQAGENPVQCELRVYKPSFVFISLEVWWEGRTADRYEALLRQIVDIAIKQGVVPILATKADNVEGNQSINLATAKVAYDYDLPLWNFWSAVQPLPNNGMDATRPDHFHISVSAWNVRSFSALSSLDSVWRGVRDLQPASANTSTPASPATASGSDPSAATPVPLPAITLKPKATPMGNSGRIVFGAAERAADGYQNSGIYLYDIGASQLITLRGAGYDLQAVSPDGKQILFNQGASLYRSALDGSGVVKLSDALYSSSALQRAAWLPDGSAVVAVLNSGGKSAVTLLGPDGVVQKTLTGDGDSPIGLFPLRSGINQVYWQKGVCRAAEDCTYQGVFGSALDGSSAAVQVIGSQGPIFSVGKDFLAISRMNEGDKRSLAVLKPGAAQARPLDLPGDHLVDAAWSPDGRSLAVEMLLRSDYSGRNAGMRNFIVLSPNWDTKELPQNTGLNSRLAWSPDNLNLVYAGTEPTDQGYKIILRRMNLLGNKVEDLPGSDSLQSTNFILVTNLSWVPGETNP